MTFLFGFFVFVFGLVFGSFLNVCIYRFPRGESVIRPGSHCPACQKSIGWRDNLPLASFISLGGKCRHCGAKIAPRYFMVELISGLLWVGIWLTHGLTPYALAGIVLVSILLAVTVTDFETGLIPDALSLPGIGIGLLLGGLFPELQGTNVWYLGLVRAALGLVMGGGIIYLTGMIGSFVFRRESMGGGDVKLLAMIGAFLGVKKTALVFLFAPFAAMPFALYTLFLKARKKEDLRYQSIPYGPFLAVTAAIFYFFGDKISSVFFAF